MDHITRLFEVPEQHITTTKGYREWTDKKTKKQKVSWVMEHRAQLDTWEVAVDYWRAVQDLKSTSTLPTNWNKHDDGIITGFIHHIGPFDYKIDGKLCQFLDPIEDQIHKHYKAVKKLHKHLGNEEISKADYLRYMMIDEPQRSLDKNEMFNHCEQRRRMKADLLKLRSID